MFRAENEGQLQCTYLQAEWISLMSLLLIISCCINVATHLAQIITKKMLCENKLKEKRQVFFFLSPAFSGYYHLKPLLLYSILIQVK